MICIHNCLKAATSAAIDLKYFSIIPELITDIEMSRLGLTHSVLLVFEVVMI